MGTGDQVLTGGVVISGSQSQSVLIRAIGPSLAQFNVTGLLSNVEVRLFSSASTTTPIAVSRVITGQAIALGNELGAFALGENAQDAAIVAVLAPGSYTAEVTGVDGVTGVAIIEVYELD
ncbi:MAG: hypothetical protein J6386_04140 [Candidatus Synoicihabitans palmerolidicus]|nr:hypothetical protein [Candidatus Synoicihabitans palmerolidicus]